MPAFIIGLLLNLGQTPVNHEMYHYQEMVLTHYFAGHLDEFEDYLDQCLQYDLKPPTDKVNEETARNFCSLYRDEMKEARDRKFGQ